MSDVTVIVPWRPGCRHREAAWDWCRTMWRTHHPDWAVVTAQHTAGPWSKARAIATALPRTGILVIADADVWCHDIGHAVSQVGRGAAWAMPHDRVYRLTADSTRLVLGGTPPHPRLRVVQPAYTGWPGGGMVAIGHATYQRIPMDPRYEGWGQEDESWALALTTLAGPAARGTGRLWHMWHPPQSRLSRRWGSEASRDLAMRYRAADGSPSHMRALISWDE